MFDKMPQALQFSWHLNLRWIKILLVAILPGLLISIISGNLLWLTGSFLTVCSILPYTVSHNKSSLVFVHALLVMVIIFLIVFSLRVNIYYLLIILPILALIAGSIDNIHQDLHSFSAWLIIGGVYGGVKFSHYSLSVQQFIGLVLLTVFSLSSVVLFFFKEIKPITFQLILPAHPQFIFNFKYVLPIIIAVIVWIKFDLEEPQWIFWSSLSVVYPDIDNSILKLKQRGYGALFGAGLGLIIGLLLPNSVVITYICFVMIMLSLKMFDDYFPGFFLRCFFAVLYAGNLSTSIALVRLSNVVLGGIIGLVCTYILVIIYHSKLYRGNL